MNVEAGRASIGRFASGSDSSTDIFDSAVDLEREQIEQGFREGYEQGSLQARQEGREVGLKAGFDTGEEVGFYSGCALVWQAVLAKDPLAFSSRAQRSVTQLVDLIAAVPLLEPQNEALHDLLARVRAKFRVTVSLLGVHIQPPGPSPVDTPPTDF
eukprot:TRINITY_DN14959_c0_g1_i1.p1 TRINITY_DN14959_c0_g1~~TRINITY_DN14959_c0_g1_i1.p1  ORF type:complete len:156 (+),score=28.59 TRINITY_DN14959_c0_g1_i1:95-562(+)